MINPMFAKFDQALGKTTPTDGVKVPSRAEEVMAMESKQQVKSQVAPSAPIIPAFSQQGATKMVTDIASDLNKRGQSVQESIDMGNKGGIGKKLEAGYQIAGDIAGGAGDIAKNAIGAITPKPVSDAISSGVGAVADTGAGHAVMSKLSDFWHSLSPEEQKNISATTNIASLLLANKASPDIPSAEQTKTAVSSMASDLGKTKDVVGVMKQGVGDITQKFQDRSVAKAEQASINAVNPELKGKNLVGAYKQAVTGQREVTPPSMFREQGLTPNEQTINLGKRLSDVRLGDNHIKNLDKLGTALDETESKLSTALKGDPEINFNADKPTILQSLEDAKSKIPREFQAIKDSKNASDNVFNFAKEKIASTEDSIAGIRDARTSFDSQARLEYPNAFKDGIIDVKTPAGRAIKEARNMINEHLYNTAPNGSEIQKLIGREADIFRATDAIAPKAAAGQGKSVIKQLITKHPYIAGAVGLGVAERVAHTIGIPLPAL